MDEDGEDDERDAHPEGKVHFAVFAEEEGGEGDAVHGLQVVGEVHREGRQGAEGDQLEQERDDGKDRSQQQEPKHVAPGRNDFGRWQEGNERRQENDPADEFVQQHGGAVLTRHARDIDIQQGEQGIERRRQQSERDAQPVPHVQAENQEHARDGDEADQDLGPHHPLPVDERVQQGGEKAGGGDARYADGHVRRLDAGIKRHPVKGEYAAAAGDQDEGFPGKPMQPAGERQHEAERRHADHHPVPHQRQPAERNQPAEDARPSGQEHGRMEQKQRFCFLSHAMNSLLGHKDGGFLPVNQRNR